MMTRWMMTMQLALPDTALGWFELAAFVVVYVTAFVTLKLTQRQQGKDLNGLGDRVKDLELGAERRQTQINTVSQLLAGQDNALRDAQKDIAHIETWQENFQREQQQMKEDIIGFISQRTSEITTAVHDLDKRVALLQHDMERTRKDNERRDNR